MSWVERRFGRLGTNGLGTPKSPNNKGKGGGKGAGAGGRRGRRGGASGDPFAASVVYLNNFDGTHLGIDAQDEGPLNLPLTYVDAVLGNGQRYNDTLYGTSLYLGDNPSHCWIPDAAGGHNFLMDVAPKWTIEVRIRASVLSGLQYILEGGVHTPTAGSGLPTWYLRTNASKLEWSDERGGGTGMRLQDPASLVISTWYEIAISCDGTSLYMHKDGVIVDTDTPTAKLMDPRTPQNFLIGVFRESVNAEWNGHMQAVRVTKDDRYGGANYTPFAGKWTA